VFSVGLCLCVFEFSNQVKLNLCWGVYGGAAVKVSCWSLAGGSNLDFLLFFVLTSTSARFESMAGGGWMSADGVSRWI
jgi:hypothetical protein